MTKTTSIFLYFILSTTMYSQIHEVGIFVGGSNYIGDIGPTDYIAPDALAFGLLYKYNKSPRHAFRLSHTQSKINSNDLDSSEGSRNQRGYYFENSIKEVSLGLEYNFFDFNLHQIGNKTTPYIYSGLAYTRYSSILLGVNNDDDEYRKGTFAIPMTVGIKTRLNRRFILAAEIGARYTFADDLDGKLPNNGTAINMGYGNKNNNDWYVFSGVTLTYTFGEKPCYCSQ